MNLKKEETRSYDEKLWIQKLFTRKDDYNIVPAVITIVFLTGLYIFIELM